MLMWCAMRKNYQIYPSKMGRSDNSFSLHTTSALASHCVLTFCCCQVFCPVQHCRSGYYFIYPFHFIGILRLPNTRLGPTILPISPSCSHSLFDLFLFLLHLPLLMLLFSSCTCSSFSNVLTLYVAISSLSHLVWWFFFT